MLESKIGDMSGDKVGLGIGQARDGNERNKMFLQRAAGQRSG